MKGGFHQATSYSIVSHSLFNHSIQWYIVFILVLKGPLSGYCFGFECNIMLGSLFSLSHFLFLKGTLEGQKEDRSWEQGHDALT